MPLADACRSRDFSYIAGWVSGRFDVEVTDVEIKEWFSSAPHNIGECAGKWTDGSWFMWLRNRLAKRGEFRGAATDDSDPFIATAVLHVFFLNLSETDEMLRRLSEVTYQKRQADIARSKLFEFNRTPQPIDKTAFLVGGKEP